MRYFIGLLLCLLLAGTAQANDKTIELHEFCPHHKDAIVCGGDMAIDTDVKINRCGYIYSFKEYEKAVKTKELPDYPAEQKLYRDNPEYCPC
jgi:hypothetical protein